MKKTFRIILIITIVGLFIGFFVYLAMKEKKPEVSYEIKTPFKTNIIRKTVATGSIVPRKEIEIKPQQVSGIIEEIYVEAGQMIKAGEKIAKIRVIPEMGQLNAAEARLKQAEISFEDAKQIYDKQKALYEDGVIAEQKFQEYKVQLNKAETELDAADNQLKIVKEGAMKVKGQSNTIITSTITGMILDVPVEEGNTVVQTNTFNQGTTIATVANMNDLIFEGKLDEAEVGKIREGMNLFITIGAIEDVKFNAALEYVSPKGIEENGTILFPIKAKVQLVDTIFIRAGYSATADIVLEKRDSVLAINESLLQFQGDSDDSTYVEIETAPQVFEKRYVTTGLSDGINIQILDGLTLDDKIKGLKMQ